MHDHDVLIIGSGPAGAAYARAVAEAAPDASIVMIEVGPKLGERDGVHTANLPTAERVTAQMRAQGPDAEVERAGISLSGDADGEPFFFPGTFPVGAAPVDGEHGLPAACLSSGIGGMGVHWGGSCPEPSRFERITIVPPDELAALYDRARDLLGVSTDLHGDDDLLATMRDLTEAEFGGDPRDGTAIGFMPVAVRVEGGRFVRTGTGRILGDVVHRPTFQLRSRTLAQRLLVDGGAVVGARLLDRDSGRVDEVRARRVVVCADSLRTPQLLYASGIRPPALGHHLNDHLQMSGVVMLRPELVRDLPDPAAGITPSGSVLIPFGGPARPAQGQILALSRLGMAFPVGDGKLDGAFDFGVPPELMAQLGILAFYGAKDVRFDDAVTFSDHEVDHDGMPRMSIRYTLTEQDQATLATMRDMIGRAAAVVGTLVQGPSFAPGGSSIHYQGTVRMGLADDGTSVCDTHGRVWGTEHLYVGGNGVIPVATAANPTLTTVALATRFGTALAESL